MNGARERGAASGGLWPRFAAAFALLAALAAQDKPQPAAKDETDIKRLAAKDPYTEADPARMAAAGIVAFAPFAWADGNKTSDVDRVLGEHRILWIETAHFRIGCSLGTTLLPVAQDKRKFVLDELKRLKLKLPKLDETPRKLDPWLRAHLYAQRAEELYAEVQKLLSVTDADFGTGTEPGKGHYLGLPDKYLLLLFQKKSDLARYLDRFCGAKDDVSFCFYHPKSNQMGAAIALEGLEGADDLALLSHTTYSLTNNLITGYRGFWYDLPLWLREGVAHSFARRVPSEFVNVLAKETEAVDEETQHEWPQKVRRRASFDRGWLTFAQLVGIHEHKEFGFQANLMAWSRVDYLLAQDRAKVGLMLTKLKSLPVPTGVRLPIATVDAQAASLLQELFSLDAASFDKNWREWVLKTYPKK